MFITEGVMFALTVSLIIKVRRRVWLTPLASQQYRVGTPVASPVWCECDARNAVWCSLLRCLTGRSVDGERERERERERGVIAVLRRWLSLSLASATVRKAHCSDGRPEAKAPLPHWWLQPSPPMGATDSGGVPELWFCSFQASFSLVLNTQKQPFRITRVDSNKNRVKKK